MALSIGLWITAGIAWFYTLFWEAVVTFLSNPSVPINDRVLFGAIVIPVAPMLIVLFAILLWGAYQFAPRRLPVREVFDGLFGLQNRPTIDGSSSSPAGSETSNNSNESKPSEPALIAEYQSLSLFINSRRTQQMAINGITITGAIGILTLALSQSSSLGAVGGWVSLFPIFLILLTWINWRGLVLVDSYSYKRVHEIEKLLKVYGHHGIVGNLDGKLLYEARYWFWDVLYVIILLVSVATSAYLFVQYK